MLEDPAHQDVARWGKGGDTFVVVEGEKFTRSILPKHFKHSNMSSFIRQLNKYDFHKVKPSSDSETSIPGGNANLCLFHLSVATAKKAWITSAAKPLRQESRKSPKTSLPATASTTAAGAVCRGFPNESTPCHRSHDVAEDGQGPETGSV
ncbi:hypothetical protein UVI_02062800 [Ustilaginoidea virens]|uniref:HSF-type DNA-binding domain-containing protein n=1 Tax=Ustilaginoidea virens TaxID=1159556 RepID=A0A1B5L833_USTVR|nr:hypothetical protein UVI_02062800 [Ustilaginoidea virens]